MILILRILKMAGQNIYRNGLVSLVAVLVITLLFVIFNGLLFANSFQKSALDVVNSRLDLAINFTDDIAENKVVAIERDLLATFPEIREMTFISSKKAFANFVENFGEANRELSMWLAANTGTSPLPATLVISANAELHAGIIKFLDESSYSRLFNLDSPATGTLVVTAADKIIALDRTLSRISFIATIAFSALAILIIIAVLRLAIFSRGMEIGIMRLVGATRQFIRMPFILEGVFFGFAASLVGAVVFFVGLSQFDPTLFAGGNYGSFGEILATTIENFFGDFALILAWQILAAIAIGTFASFIATRRYLNSREVVFN